MILSGRVNNDEDMSDENKDIEGMASEASIKRAIEQFQRDGLLDPNNPGSYVHNEIQTEVFCRQVLELHDSDTVYTEQQKIIKCWQENNSKS